MLYQNSLSINVAYPIEKAKQSKSTDASLIEEKIHKILLTYPIKNLMQNYNFVFENNSILRDKRKNGNFNWFWHWLLKLDNFHFIDAKFQVWSRKITMQKFTKNKFI